MSKENESEWDRSHKNLGRFVLLLLVISESLLIIKILDLLLYSTIDDKQYFIRLTFLGIIAFTLMIVGMVIAYNKSKHQG
jgi:hypothetical protein